MPVIDRARAAQKKRPDVWYEHWGNIENVCNAIVNSEDFQAVIHGIAYRPGGVVMSE